MTARPLTGHSDRLASFTLDDEIITYTLHNEPEQYHMEFCDDLAAFAGDGLKLDDESDTASDDDDDGLLLLCERHSELLEHGYKAITSRQRLGVIYTLYWKEASGDGHIVVSINGYVSDGVVFVGNEEEGLNLLTSVIDDTA